jgi:hypothetical protein
MVVIFVLLVRLICFRRNDGAVEFLRETFAIDDSRGVRGDLGCLFAHFHCILGSKQLTFEIVVLVLDGGLHTFEDNPEVVDLFMVQCPSSRAANNCFCLYKFNIQTMKQTTEEYAKKLEIPDLVAFTAPLRHAKTGWQNFYGVWSSCPWFFPAGRRKQQRTSA